LGPGPGVGVVAKRPQGRVQCEDHLRYCNFIFYTALHDARGPRRGRPGFRARSSGALGWGFNAQCSARALFRAAPFKIK
jgi:hypothetical protein